MAKPGDIKMRMIIKTGFWPEFYKIGFLLFLGILVGAIFMNYWNGQNLNERFRMASVYKAIEIEGTKYNLQEVP